MSQSDKSNTVKGPFQVFFDVKELNCENENSNLKIDKVVTGS